jgi:hypothetical protein
MAIREKLVREALGEALREVEGSIDVTGYPAWTSPAKVSRWVEATRRADHVRLKRRVRRPRG